MSVTNNRSEYLDIAKGLGIVLVVLGHSIPDATTAAGISSPVLRTVSNLIYSFHMPLFFFIAGYLMNKEKLQALPKLAFFWKRCSRLLVPYFFVGLCYLPMKLLFASFANKPYDINNLWKIFLGVNPDGELWFLYALWGLSVIAILLNYTSTRLVLLVGLALAQLTIGFTIITDNFFFFAAGLYLRDKGRAPYAQGFASLAVLLVLFAVGNWLLYVVGYHGAKVITGVAGTGLLLTLSKLISTKQMFISGGRRFSANIPWTSTY